MPNTYIGKLNAPSAINLNFKLRKSERAQSGNFAFFSLCFLVAIAAAASALFFSKQSLRLDESQSLWQSSHNPAMVIHLIAQDVHVPLYPLMLHFWMQLFGSAVSETRLLSLIFFLASIPAIYFLGKKILNPSWGLFVAALTAVSPFLNWYGNETRMYSLLALITIINQYFFVSLFLDVKEKNSEQITGFWIGYLASALVGIYSHYFFWLILLTQGLFFLFNQRLFPKHSFRNLAIIALVLIAAISPWVWYVLRLGLIGQSTPLLAKPSSVDFFNTFSQFFFGYQDDHINTIIVSFWPLSVLLAFLTLRKNNRLSPAVVFLFLSAFLPIVLAFVVSVTVRPLFLTRYLILCIPALYLLLVTIIATYPKKLALGIKIILIVVMLAGLVQEGASASNPAKENYQQAALYLNQNAKPQDVIAVSAPFTVYPVEYYYQGPASITTVPFWNRYTVGPIPNFSMDNLKQQVDQLAQNHDTIWLLLSYNQGYENQVKLYFDTHYQRVYAQNYSPDLNLYAYKLKYNSLSFSDIISAVNQVSINSRSTPVASH